MEQGKRVGIIENLSNIVAFKDTGALECSTDVYNAAVGGNTGNLAFVLGTHLSIGNPKTRISWDTPLEQVKAQVDHIVVCCANQIGHHADLSDWADRLEVFGLPVTLVGLGAQTPNYEEHIQIPDGSKRFLERVATLNASAGSNIGVRGEFTRNVLKNLGYEAHITGCPSLFISSDATLGQTIARADIAGSEAKIAVAAGNPYHQATRELERNLVEIVEKTHGAYIIQHPDIMISFATGRLRAIDREEIPKILEAYGSKFDATSLLKWFRRHSFAFYDAIVWMDFLHHYDGVVGPRYHGVALGVQAGRTSVVVHIDNHTRELAETTGIKSISAEAFKDYTLEDVLALVRWSEVEGAAFDRNRHARAQTLVEFLHGNGLHASPRLKTLAVNAPDNNPIHHL